MSNDFPDRLRIDGPNLIKPNGKPIWLRGPGWGTWGENIESDAAAAKAMGANCVRLSLLRWLGLYGGTDVDAFDPRGYGFIKRANLERAMREVSWLVAQGLWLVPFIDTNCLQDGTQTPEMREYCDPAGAFGDVGRNFTTDRPMFEVLKGVWRIAALALRRVPRVAMLELMPEPLDGRGPEWAAPTRDMYRELRAVVREVDPVTPVLVGPRDGYEAKYCDEAYMSECNDVVYTGNFLTYKLTHREAFDESMAAIVAMRDGRGVPIYLQQVGRKSVDDPDLEHMRYALEEIAARRLGFSWWQNKQNTVNPDEYALHYKDGQGGWVAKQAEIDLLSSFMRGEVA